MLSLQVPEGGRSAAPGTVCGADDAAVPTFIFKIEAVLGMRFCDPEQLIAKKRRNKLAAADKAICYFTRGKFRVDRHDDGYTDTWVEHELRQVAAVQRTAEASSGGAATNAAVAEFEEGLEQRRCMARLGC